MSSTSSDHKETWYSAKRRYGLWCRNCKKVTVTADSPFLLLGVVDVFANSCSATWEHGEISHIPRIRRRPSYMVRGLISNGKRWVLTLAGLPRSRFLAESMTIKSLEPLTASSIQLLLEQVGNLSQLIAVASAGRARMVQRSSTFSRFIPTCWLQGSTLGLSSTSAKTTSHGASGWFIGMTSLVKNSSVNSKP